MRKAISVVGTSLLAVAMVLGVALTGVPPAAAAAQATFYVAPDGDDSNPGSVTAPFRTLQHARDVVRATKGTMTGDITVYLRGGDHPVTSTVEFGAEDSGTGGFRVVYAAYPGETPVLTGGVRVTGWTQHSGNIWKAPLDRSTKLRALYVNDKRAVMASKTISSQGCQGTYAITAGQAAWAWESGSQCAGARYSTADFPTIAANQDDLEIETATTWTTAIVGVRQVTTEGGARVATFQQPGAAIAQGAFNGNAQPGGTHKVMNAYEFLDTPGEFYYDRASRTVFYYKAAADNMATATVFAPGGVSTVLRIAGTTTSNHARDLTFSGLTVQHSDWNLVNVAGSVFKQAQQGNLSATAYAKQNFHAYHYRNVDLTPGIVELRNADGIRLLRNQIQHTGADGISLANDVQNAQLIGNRTNDIAGSAISVGHPQHVYIGDATSSNREKYPVQVEGLVKNIEISNNYLYDSAVLFNGHSPISAYFADTLTVRHNLIRKAPWSGITLGWGWWNFDGSSGSIAPGRPTTTARNNTISDNQIVDTVQRLSDTGPIYTLGSQPGTTVTGNYLLGVPAGHKYGLHPDEGSAYISFRDNVLSIDKNVTWMINSDDFGRKHDLSLTQTYGPINKVSNKNLPNSTVQDILVSADYVWPAAAYGIAVNSGLEDAYRDIVPPGELSLPDHVLPASTYAAAGSSLRIRGTGDASRRIWLAPAGTTTFAAGPTMTTTDGAATTIAVPSSAGEYRLFVVDAQGNRSAASTFIVRSQGGGGQQSGQIVGAQSSRCVDVPSGTTTNGTQTQLWDCDGTAKQRWTHTSGRQLTALGKCLDASGNGTADGTAVIIWDCHGGTNQQWTVDAGGSITSASAGLCLDASNAGTANGTKLILWRCNGGANQRWTLRS